MRSFVFSCLLSIAIVEVYACSSKGQDMAGVAACVACFVDGPSTSCREWIGPWPGLPYSVPHCPAVLCPASSCSEDSKVNNVDQVSWELPIATVKEAAIGQVGFSVRTAVDANNNSRGQHCTYRITCDLCALNEFGNMVCQTQNHARQSFIFWAKCYDADNKVIKCVGAGVP